VVEGQSTSVTYTVTMSAASPLAVSVAYATANGTATAGSDYTASSGTLSFAPGEISKTITINLPNDTINEPDETFSLSLSAPTNATLGSPSSVITTLTDTLVATSSTVLPTGIENLRLDGTSAINGTGNSGANRITGNNGANVLKGGGGIDTLTGLDGTDSFDLSGINSAANRCTITDFITGTQGEKILLSDSFTSRIGTTPLLAVVNQGSQVSLNTTNSDVFSFNFNNTEADVNLSNSTNGSALLDGLNAANGSASLSTSSRGGSGYIVAYDNANAYLYSFNAGSNSAVIASEIALIGILDSSNSIAVGALTANNFSLV
jgi:serralysin